MVSRKRARRREEDAFELGRALGYAEGKRAGCWTDYDQAFKHGAEAGNKIGSITGELVGFHKGLAFGLDLALLAGVDFSPASIFEPRPGDLEMLRGEV